MTISPPVIGAKEMIDEEATFEKFGYYAKDLKQKSAKKIVAVCDDCGKVRVLRKFQHRAFCRSCSKKGANSYNWQGGEVVLICEMCGTKFPRVPSDIKSGTGKFCNCKCHGKWLSKHFRGENAPGWKGGKSFEPYCHKFNDEFKEYIRDKFGRICFLCDKTEAENGRRLSVHHVNYNKDCGCDEDETCQFAPLCISCNSKVNFNRKMWESKIKAMMHNKLNGWYI